MPVRPAARTLFTFLFLALMSTSLMAQSTWIGGGDGTSWNDPLNWNPSGVPTLADDAIFNAGTYNISIPTSVAKELNLSGGSNITFSGTNTLTLSGSTTINGVTALTLNGTNLAGQTIRIGNTASGGTLNIQGGSNVTSNRGRIGEAAGMSGTTNVSGTGSLWNVTDTGFGLGLRIDDFGDGILNITGGGKVTNVFGYAGAETDSTGSVLVSGTGSRWENSENAYIGWFGDGTLLVEAGGVVTSDTGIVARIGVGKTSTSTATITGSGSRWVSTTGDGEMHIGLDVGSNGTLNILDGGVVDDFDGTIGYLPGSNGTVNVADSGSLWSNSLGLYVGGFTAAGGTGTLNISNDGSVSAGGTTKLYSGGTINLNSGILKTGSFENTLGGTFNHTGGSLIVEGGNFSPGTAGYTIDGAGNPLLKLTGTGSNATFTSSITIGDSSQGTLTVEDSGILNSSSGFIGNSSASTGTATITGAGSQWNTTGTLYVGLNGTGTLNVEDGALSSSSSANAIGWSSGSTGTATITGAGSQWSSSTNVLFVGGTGTGILNVEAGGEVSNTIGRIARDFGSTGTATVTGAGSKWINSNVLRVGESGTGTLSVEAGGSVSSLGGDLGRFAGSMGTATVTGVNSIWDSTEDMYIGGFVTVGGGNGTLNVNDSGTVMVGGNTKVWGAGTINVDGGNFDGGTSFENMGTVNVLSGLLDVSPTTYNQSAGITNLTGGIIRSNDFSVTGGTFTVDGGRFEFGTTTASNIGNLNLVSGSLVGVANLSGFTNVASLTALQNTSVDMTDVLLSNANAGVLYGSGLLSTALFNQGELRTLATDFVYFAGDGHNADRITNLGGLTEFGEHLTNQAGGEINNFGGTVILGTMTNELGGEINGRGQFIANVGWINQGEMRFSNGTTDVLGAFDHQAGGVIITSGDGTTTFYDDVVHNGAEIRTADGSNTVFFGDLSGSGAFTGSGDVLIEGGYSPGSSPNVITIDGTLRLGSSSMLEIELAGIGYGEFDRLEIGEDLYLAGQLDVLTIDDFQLGHGQEFIFADVTRDLFGQFSNFGEGDLVGNFNGTNLFISYSAGDGNDVGLFSVVPEPGSAIVLIGMMLGVGLRRRRS